MEHEQFTRFEIARIIGARALQLAMDAPLLIKISEEDLKKINYDALKIAEIEFNGRALPITVHRPLPKKKKEKLVSIKEERVSDEDMKEKEKEIEKDISRDPEEFNLVEEEEHVEEVAIPFAGEEA